MAPGCETLAPSVVAGYATVDGVDEEMRSAMGAPFGVRSKEPVAHVRLKLGELGAHGRLGQVEGLGGAGHVADPGQGHEGLEGGGVHAMLVRGQGDASRS